MLDSILFLSVVIGCLVLLRNSSLQGSCSSQRLFDWIVTMLTKWFSKKPDVQITNNYINQINIFCCKEEKEEPPYKQEDEQAPNSPESDSSEE